jgi:hypothetical protein
MNETADTERARLDEQLERGIALLRAAHALQVKALEIVRGSGLSINLEELLGPHQQRALFPSQANQTPNQTENRDEKSEDVHRDESDESEDAQRGDLGKAVQRALGRITSRQFGLADLMRHLPADSNVGSVRGLLNRMSYSEDTIRRVKAGTPHEPAVYEKI